MSGHSNLTHLDVRSVLFRVSWSQIGLPLPLAGIMLWAFTSSTIKAQVISSGLSVAFHKSCTLCVTESEIHTSSSGALVGILAWISWMISLAPMAYPSLMPTAQSRLGTHTLHAHWTRQPYIGPSGDH